MTLTPSATSGFFAGIALSALGWLTLSHIDGLPLIGKVLTKEKIYSWVNKNKVLAFTLGEIANFAVHGVTNPASVSMALGSSLINSGMVFGFIPIRMSRRKNQYLGQGKVIQGALTHGR